MSKEILIVDDEADIRMLTAGILEDEGHGFYKPEHRTKYFKTVLSFLDEHLKL